ncbi:type IV secretion system protein VirB5 [Bartonella chomelii]|uniref:VblB5 protein n=2 Tax=Bartonella TaxID=773 RepID=A0A024LQZ1_9HYPH|nr:type IV secretion system protein [Bartonella chomelii]MBA9083380.1 type IV secretion system protein VirB5 [Bartonella chomelii]CDP79603.1 VblB5 protein [Bartonella schoenbuchensis]CDP79622.1 VblB5 protein [Bartonella schoenbuchensis]
MRKILLTIAFCIISFGLTPNVLAQMPTFDAAAVAKMIEQLKQGKQQLDQLTSQIDEMKKLYGSLNGIADLSSLQEMLNNKEIQAALPSNFGDFEKLLDGKSGNSAKWEEKLSYKKPAGGAGSKEAVDAFYEEEVKKAEQRNQGQAATGEAVYASANEVKQTIEQLMKQLKNAQTAGEVQSIQAQLAATQAMLQTQVLQMQAAAMIQQAEIEAAELRYEEELRARYKSYADQL